MFSLLEGVNSRLDEVEIKREAAIKRIREVDARLIIYTDGSATSGIFDGGSAVVVPSGDAETPAVIETIRRKGAKFTCSYEEEVDAMNAATDWIQNHDDGQSNTLICTDSQSLCMAMESFNPETDQIRYNLRNHQAPVTIQWIPGHSDVPGNEMADQAAKEATELEAPLRPISFRSACMMANRSIHNHIEHPRTREVYKYYSKEREGELTSRRQQVTIAQLRSGKHKKLGAYQNKLDDSVPKECQRCDSGDDHTLEHWFLHCPGTMAAKRRIFFGEKEEGLGLLTKCPAKTIALAEETLGEDH